MDDSELPHGNKRFRKRKVRRRGESKTAEQHSKEKSRRRKNQLDLLLDGYASSDSDDEDSLTTPEQGRPLSKSSSATSKEQSVRKDVVDVFQGRYNQGPPFRNHEPSADVQTSWSTFNHRPQYYRNSAVRTDNESALKNMLLNTQERHYASPNLFHQTVGSSPFPLEPGNTYNRAPIGAYSAVHLYNRDSARDTSQQWDEPEAAYDDRYGETTTTEVYCPMPSRRN